MSEENNQPIRVRLPKDGEVIGIILQLLGFAKMRVKCTDGKTRICRVPGRLLRSLWLRERDIVIVKPWEISGETKGDVIYKYKKTEVKWLLNHGYLKEIEDELVE